MLLLHLLVSRSARKITEQRWIEHHRTRVETAAAVNARVGFRVRNLSVSEHNHASGTLDDRRIEISLRNSHHRAAEYDLGRIIGDAVAHIEEIAHLRPDGNDEVRRSVHAGTRHSDDA